MIIVLPVEKKSMDSCINKTFGRTPYFLIYDIDSKKETFVDNPAINSPGGAGVKASQLVLDYKANAALAPSIGKNSADVLQGAGVALYLTKGCSIQENIDMFLAGKLETLSDIHAGFHNH